MAEEKNFYTRAEASQKTSYTGTKKEGFSLRNEVKGIIVIGVAILALLGFLALI